jgi:hypothetical protein
MFDDSSRELIIQVSYFITAFLFIFGLKRMSSPVTARNGIPWAGAGMLVATAVTLQDKPSDASSPWVDSSQLRDEHRPVSARLLKMRAAESAGRLEVSRFARRADWYRHEHRIVQERARLSD